MDDKLARSMDKYDAFEHWLLSNGAEFSQVELRSYDDSSVSQSISSSEVNYSEEKKECKSTDSEMRGVHAKSDIPVDTICIKIPKKCLITVEMGIGTKIGEIVFMSSLDLDAPKHIYLMIFLLYDMKINGESSFFRPYYDILPKSLRNIPIFWSAEELKYLQGSYLLCQIEERIEAITEDYNAICSVAPQFSQIASLEEFKWARMCVCSRNFGLSIHGYRTSALVPHADMLNHHRPRQTKWCYDDDLESFTITTLQPIAAGSQVYDSYGQKCNHRFLLNYGFAVEDNTEYEGFCPNEVSIELYIPADDVLYEERSKFWDRGDCSVGNNSNSGTVRSNHSISGALPDSPANTEDIIVTLPSHKKSRSQSLCSNRSFDRSFEQSSKRVRVSISSNENVRIFFSMLRVLASNQEELRLISTSQTLPFGESGCSVHLSRALQGYIGSNVDISVLTMQHAAFFRTCRDIRNPLNLMNEKNAMKQLSIVVMKALSNYHCSLAQDIIDLNNEILFPKLSNKRHAKIQIRGEKEVLHHFALWSETALGVIEVVEREIKRIRREEVVTGLEVTTDQYYSFEDAIQALEDDGNIHFTILRYCTDVLGALRKDAISKEGSGRDIEEKN